jgi:hypothetical protein
LKKALKRVNWRAAAIVTIVAAFFVLFQTSVTVNASIFSDIFGDNKADALEFLQKNAPYLRFVGLLGYFGNIISWGIIKFLYSIAQGAEGLTDSIIKIGNLLNNAEISKLYSGFVKDVVWGVMLICLIWFAIRYATGGTNSGLSIGTTAKQIIISVMLLALGPTMIGTLYDTTTNAFQNIASSGNDDIATSVITSNMDDILYLASNNKYTHLFPGDSTDPSGNNAKYGDNAWKKGGASKGTLLTTDLSAVLNKDDIAKAMDKATSEQKTSLGYLNYRIDTDGDGKAAAIEIPDDDGFPFITVFKPGYERYPANKTVIMLSLVSVMVAFVIVSFTIAMALIELPFKVIAGSLAIATLSEQKIKTVVNDISQTFLLVFWTAVELRFYQIIMGALSTKLSGHALALTIAYVSATALLWKGQDSLTKYFGIDTGLRGGAGALMAAYGAAQLARHGISGIAQGGKSAINAIRGGNDTGNAAGVTESTQTPSGDASGASGADTDDGLMHPSNLVRHPISSTKNAVQHPFKTAESAIRTGAAAATYAKESGPSGLAYDTAVGTKNAAEGVLHGAQSAAQAVAKPAKSAITAAQEGAAIGSNAAQQRWQEPSADSAQDVDETQTSGTPQGVPQSAAGNPSSDASGTSPQSATKQMERSGPAIDIKDEPDQVTNTTGQPKSDLSVNSKPEAAGVANQTQSSDHVNVPGSAVDAAEQPGQDRNIEVNGGNVTATSRAPQTAQTQGTPVHLATTPGESTQTASDKHVNAAPGSVDAIMNGQQTAHVQGTPTKVDTTPGTPQATQTQGSSVQVTTTPGNVTQTAGNQHVNAAPESVDAIMNGQQTAHVQGTPMQVDTTPGTPQATQAQGSSVQVTTTPGNVTQTAGNQHVNVTSGSVDGVMYGQQTAQIHGAPTQVEATPGSVETTMNGTGTQHVMTGNGPHVIVSDSGAQHETVSGSALDVAQKDPKVTISGSNSSVAVNADPNQIDLYQDKAKVRNHLSPMQQLNRQLEQGQVNMPKGELNDRNE